MAEQIEVPVPHCPHCDAELPVIGLYNWAHAGWGIFCVYCPNCLKTIHLQIAPMGVPAEESRVQIPS